jgi:hypothetical protein
MLKPINQTGDTQEKITGPREETVLKRISILLLIGAALFLAGCSNPTSGDSGTTTAGYKVGDTGPSGVGIVFYITDGGVHGLEAAPSDQSTSQAWIEGGSTQSTENGNTGTAIGTGLANSNAIIAQTGHTASAAQVCRSYNGGGLSDWFLPSKDELYQLYLQRGIVREFAESTYSSSSENNSFSVWGIIFSDGKSPRFDCGKSSGYRVRAVRAF